MGPSMSNRYVGSGEVLSIEEILRNKRGNKSRYYSVQLGYLTLFETLMLKYP